MRYEWDEGKRLSNIAKHGCDFKDVVRFNWKNSITVPSDRCGEQRFASFGYMDRRLHTVVFALRGDAKRIISFHKVDPKAIPKRI